MSRLIDADAAVKQLDPNTWQGEMLIAILNGLPTAYDTEKVIEQLEQYKKIMKNNWEENGKNLNKEAIDYYRGRYNTAVDMVNIVKGGCQG